MEQLAPFREFMGTYSEALQAYLKQPREMGLRRALELGRDAMLGGLGVQEMSAIHHQSFSQLLPGIRNKEIAPALTAASHFFAESMSPFEANRREFLRSNTALRYQNRKLEDQVSRVSRVVYEEAEQLLAAAGLALNRATRKLPAAKRDHLDKVQYLLDRLAEQLTACSGDLRPRVLEDLGLSAAIQSLSRRFQAVARLDIVADAVSDAGAAPLTPEAGIALYRAVQEALANVVRHARAHRVKIRLCREDGGVQCSVWDDGVGFDPSRLFTGTAERGSGLISIWESLRLIGGTLAIHSSPGGGTEVTMAVGGSLPSGGIRQQRRPT